MSDAIKKAVRSFLLHYPMVDSEWARRFVVNNDGLFEKALVQYKKFEEKFEICNVTKVSFEDIQEELKTGKILPVVGALDKNDCPYIYIDIGKHEPEKWKFTSTIKLLHFAISSLLNSPDLQETALTIVINFKTVEKRNIDNESFLKIVRFFEDSYPCCIQNIFLLRMPWWTGFNDKVTGSLSEKTRQKIKKIDRFSEAVAPSAIPSFIGGGFDFDLQKFVLQHQSSTTTAASPNEPSVKSPTISEAIKSFESSSFDSIFGVVASPTSLLASGSSSAGEGTGSDSSAEDALESLRKTPYNGFNSKEISKRMRELDEELQSYRETHNSLDAAPEKLGLTASDYYGWVESEWMRAVQKYDNLYGRRFSATIFYEGTAYETILALKGKSKRSLSMAAATGVTPDPTKDDADMPHV